MWKVLLTVIQACGLEHQVFQGLKPQTAVDMSLQLLPHQVILLTDTCDHVLFSFQQVMFLPRYAGAYVAQVQIYSLSFLKKSDHVDKDIVPVNVTFQAIAEEPWIKVKVKVLLHLLNNFPLDFVFVFRGKFFSLVGLVISFFQNLSWI